MGSSPARLTLNNVAFAYERRRVLDGIDLVVAPGEVVGLVGPNGSGKSTVINVASGVLQRYTGTVLLEGRDLREIDRREAARSVAVVPQEPTFGFSFSALEIVLMGRHPHLAGLSFESQADIALARRLLEQCGIAALADRPIQQLSSGERQRVVFAKALAQEPRLLLLDEPASFLDIRHQVELYDLVRDLARDRGCAVLTALHDLNLAAEYCDRLVLIRDGAVIDSGATADVLTYANLTRVFDTEVYVDVNALTGKLLVVPLSRRHARAASDARDAAGRKRSSPE